MGVAGYYPVSGYYPVMTLNSPDRYPVDSKYPVLSSILQNSIRHIPIKHMHWIGPSGSGISMTNYNNTPKSLENHTKNHQVWLLCSLFCGLGLGFWCSKAR
jgi:hypothetical protein